MARHRRCAAAAALVGLALTTALGGGPAVAASGGLCTVSGGVDVSPGLTLTPQSGSYSFTSNTILACVGAISSQAVAGAGNVGSPGLFGCDSSFGLSCTVQDGDNCALGAGNGTFTASVPKVAGGSLGVTGSYNFVRLGSLVLLSGTANSSPLAGVFQFTPDVGQTCATTPVTHANVSGEALVAGP
jgi:hypothetical protein